MANAPELTISDQKARFEGPAARPWALDRGWDAERIWGKRIKRGREILLLHSFDIHFVQSRLFHHFLSVPFWLCYSTSKGKKSFFYKKKIYEFSWIPWICHGIKMALIVPLWEWNSSCFFFFFKEYVISLGPVSLLVFLVLSVDVRGCGQWAQRRVYSIFNLGIYDQQRSVPYILPLG